MVEEPLESWLVKLIDGVGLEAETMGWGYLILRFDDRAHLVEDPFRVHL